MIKDVHLKGTSDHQLYQAYTSLLKNIEAEKQSCDNLLNIVYHGKIEGMKKAKSNSKGK